MVLHHSFYILEWLVVVIVMMMVVVVIILGSDLLPEI